MFVWLGDGANEVEKSEGVTVAMVRLKKLPSQLQYLRPAPVLRVVRLINWKVRGKKNTEEVDHATMLFHWQLPERSLWRSFA